MPFPVVWAAYVLFLFSSADAFSPGRNESDQNVSVNISPSSVVSSQNGTQDLKKELIAFEFLSPKGMRIYITNPSPSRSPHRVSLLLVNQKTSGHTAEWKSHEVLHSGSRWGLTFPELTVSQGDVLRYRLGVVFIGDTSSDENNYSDTYTVRDPHPHGIVSSPPSEELCQGLKVYKENSSDLVKGLTCTTYPPGIYKLWRFEAEKYIGRNSEDAFTLYDWDSWNQSNNIISCTPTPLEVTFEPNTDDNTVNSDLYSSKYLISPPVKGCRMNSKRWLRFQYGTVEVKAKLPAGDWIVSEIALEPADREYGDRSGRIVIARSRGNDQLQTEQGEDFSNKVVEVGIELADYPYLFRKTLKKSLAEDYHTFKLNWTKDGLRFLVDDMEIGRVDAPEDGIDPHLSGSKMAPFDKYFYLRIGVHAGGSRDFPDRIKGKPWGNLQHDSKLNFWLARDQWQPTWKKEDSELQISSVLLDRQEVQ